MSDDALSRVRMCRIAWVRTGREKGKRLCTCEKGCLQGLKPMYTPKRKKEE